MDFISYVKSNQYAEVLKSICAKPNSYLSVSQCRPTNMSNGWAPKEHILFSCCLATLLYNRLFKKKMLLKVLIMCFL